ncbi:MAG: CHASE domain-containing protein [Ignavibacteriales bacterium]
MREYEKILLGGAGLFDVSPVVTRKMWHDYVDRLMINTTHPGIQGIGFTVYIHPSGLEAHIRKIKEEGFPDYHVWPEGKRDAYTSIIYLEPFTGINLRAFGYDMYSEPVRHEAMSKAINTGKTAVTGKVKLVQETNAAVQAGFLMYVPIYKKNLALNSVEQKQQAIAGFVYSPFRVNDLMNGILWRGLPDIRLRIYDGKSLESKTLMYDSDSTDQKGGKGHDPLFTEIEVLDINNHLWTLHFSSQPALESSFDNQKSIIILISGLIISFLFFTIVKSLAFNRARAVALAAEINERERVEKALRESEERFRLITENARDLISVVDEHERYSYLSPSFSIILGYTNTELLNLGPADLVHPEDYEKISDWNNTLLSQFRLRKSDNSWIWVEGSRSKIRMNNNNYSIGIAREITERKKAEDALKNEKERAEILSGISHTFAELSLNYQAVLDMASKRTAELIGDASIIRLISADKKYLVPISIFHPDQKVNDLLHEIMSSEHQAIESGLTGKVLRDLEPLIISEVNIEEIKGNIRTEYLRYLGQFELYSIMIVPLWVGSQVIGTISVFRISPGRPYTHNDKTFLEELSDRIAIAITNSRLHQEKLHEIEERTFTEDKLKKTLDELARSNKELENFAYVASHDLQEPLRMISSYTQLIAKRYKDQLDEKADQYIEFTVEGAKRMQQLIHDLLQYSRVATKGKEFALVNCNVIVKDVLTNLQISIKKNNAVIAYNHLPKVMADDTQLMQLFQNLISNAIKFRSQKPPEIHIDAVEKENDWLFSVSDNGIGIDPQFNERIFVIFQRLHEREEYPGTGIGLAVCKKIVERHGGRIWIKSSVGEGSTFYFTLPKS